MDFCLRFAPLSEAMLRKELVIPPQAARAFARDMKAYFRTRDKDKRVAIAAKQADLLQQHWPRGARLRIAEVKEMFRQMRDHT
jgi:hypothetical protein